MFYKALVNTIAERLKDARLRAGLSQKKLAEISGVSRQLINFIEAGKRKGKSTDILLALAKALNIPPQELMGFEDKEFRIGEMVADRVKAALPSILREATEEYDALDLAELPVRGYVAAGGPSPAEQVTGDFIEVPRQLLKGMDFEKLFALKVSGDSLSGDEIYSGQSVVVNPADVAPLNGKIYIVRLGNEFCARHVYKTNGRLRLVSSDGTTRELAASEVEILGRVILSGRWKKH